MVGLSVYLLVGWSERFVKKWLLEYQIVIKTYFPSNVTVVTVVTVLTVISEVTFFGNAGLLYWELTLPIYICRCNIMYDTLIVKSLFTSPGWSKNDILWKSLGCRVVNGVPRPSGLGLGTSLRTPFLMVQEVPKSSKRYLKIQEVPKGPRGT